MIKMLSIKEAAEALRVSEALIRRIIKTSKTFPRSKIGRDWYFSEQALEQWIANGGSLQDTENDQ